MFKCVFLFMIREIFGECYLGWICLCNKYVVVLLLVIILEVLFVFVVGLVIIFGWFKFIKNFIYFIKNFFIVKINVFLDIINLNMVDKE